MEWYCWFEKNGFLINAKGYGVCPLHWGERIWDKAMDDQSGITKAAMRYSTLWKDMKPAGIVERKK